VYGFARATLPTKEVLEQYELLTKIVAFGAVAIFVLYKLFAGFHLSNMSLELFLKRAHLSEHDDALAIAVVLIKGDRGTIKLEDVAARVICKGSASPVALRGLERLHTGELRKGNWQVSGRRPSLHFTPGEKSVIGTHAIVPRGLPCVVEVVFAGKTLIYWRSGQWGASAVSLPLGNSE
jgi:hypothetical protein